MKVPKLYSTWAALWPLLSPPEDYTAEAEIIRRILNARLGARPPNRRHYILELGAGGGHTLHHLADRYDAVAVDISNAMLDLSRKLNPNVEHHVADMRRLRLGRKFSAVLAHDAIDYMICEADLRATCTTAAAHLPPGGIFLVAPTYLRETFRNHQVETVQRANARTELKFMSYVHRPDERGITFELVMLLLIRENGRLHIEEDRHTCGLFARDTWLMILDEAGFDAAPFPLPDDDAPSHMFVGVKR